jgi:hypothetical protein
MRAMENKHYWLRMAIYALVISFAWVGVAEAKGGSAKTYRSGFSSQKKSAPAAPANTAQKTAGFGSFGTVKTNTANGAAAPSPMSQDLHANATQANALKNWDARNAPKGAVAPITGAAAQATPNNSQPRYTSSGYNQPVIHQTVVHQNSSGFMNGLMWFMIGNSLAHHTNNTVYVPQNTQNNVQAPASAVAPTTGEWDSPIQAAPKPNVEAPESWMMKFLRVLLWIAVITGFVWLVKKVMQFRRWRNTRNSHYSLGS